MGVYCCKNQGEEITETDTYSDTYTYNHEDVFKTRPPCMYGHQCSCPCHHGGVCIFKLNLNTIHKHYNLYIFYIHYNTFYC